MKELIPISEKYFGIIALFTREPLAKQFVKELEFYTDGGSLIGVICLDLIDNNFSIAVLARNESMQYRAIDTIVDIETIEQAREWLKESFNKDHTIMHDNNSEYFDLFLVPEGKKHIHPHFEYLKTSDAFSSAKETIKEISYHYKDIDGNFIEQFQSLNGFDSRVFELYLFCFFREQEFSFNRKHEAPDFIIDKKGTQIAVEAVTISRRNENFTNITDYIQKDDKDLLQELEHNVPLMFSNVLFDKCKKKYWEKEHVAGKPFIIAVADFHDTMSMTWTFNSLVEYLYGYKCNDYYHAEDGRLVINPTKIEFFEKASGAKIPAGFFLNEDNKNISAVIFSATATLSKFTRIGKQAGLGNNNNIVMRNMIIYNHEENADTPKIVNYVVNEESNETWSEGIIIYHNPLATHPLNPDLFDNTVAQCFFDMDSKLVYSSMPEIFPYSSHTQNIIGKSTFA